MKTNFQLSMLIGFLVLFIGNSLLAAPRPTTYQSFDEQFERMQSSTLEQLSPAAVEEATGQKLSFFQRSALKIGKKQVARKFKRLKKRIDKYAKECDLIILADGTEIEAKVMEITATEIKYKRCGQLDGPLISESKANVFMIKYKDGTKEMISTAATSTAATSTSTATNMQETTVASTMVNVNKFNFGAFILGLLIPVLGWVVAFFHKKENGQRQRFWTWFLWGLVAWLTIWVAVYSSY